MSFVGSRDVAVAHAIASMTDSTVCISQGVRIRLVARSTPAWFSVFLVPIGFGRAFTFPMSL